MERIPRGSNNGSGDGGDDIRKRSSHETDIRHIRGTRKKSRGSQNSEQSGTNESRRQSASSSRREQVTIPNLLNTESGSGSRGSSSRDACAGSHSSSFERRGTSDVVPSNADERGSSVQRHSIQFLLNSTPQSRSSSQSGRSNLPSLHRQVREGNVGQFVTRSSAGAGPSSLPAPIEPNLDEDEITPAPATSRASRTRTAAGASRPPVGGTLHSTAGHADFRRLVGPIDESGRRKCLRCNVKFVHIEKHLQNLQRCPEPGCGYAHCFRSKMKLHADTHKRNPTAASSQTSIGGIRVGPTNEDGMTHCSSCNRKYKSIHGHLQNIHRCLEPGCGAAFCKKSLFERHMERHESKESGGASCPVCGQKFTRKSSAKNHLKMCEKTKEQREHGSGQQ